MPFDSQAFRVMIASPSDMGEERQLVRDLIHEWNALNSATEGVVLIPVMWETHAMPTAGERPQAAINDQLVSSADIIVGMFWTKLGTETGVAESGTVEEIDRFVADRKPALLYFSNRPIDPSRIDIVQLGRLREFKSATYETALVGGFASLEELRSTLSRDLMNQVRALKTSQKRGPAQALEVAAQLTDLIRLHRQHNITADEFARYRELVGLENRLESPPLDPVESGEVGPNGFPVGYTETGDKVEWIPSDDPDEPQPWPMILRRSDEAISAAYSEYWDRIWYGRHMLWHDRIESGEEKLSEVMAPIYERAREAAREIERKYGIDSLDLDTFEWGLASGRLSALAWVTGAEWDESLDT